MPPNSSRPGTPAAPAAPLAPRGNARGVAACALVGLFLVAVPPVRGQAPVKASQTGTVSQHVGAAVVSLRYDRPVARGRVLFGEGGLVSGREPWTPGANRATWIEFSEAVTLEGRRVPAGRYGLWTVPAGDDPWEVVLVSDWDRHHGVFPADSEVVRFTVEPRRAGHMETLAFYFPEVVGHDATLVMHWGTLVLPLRITSGGG